MRSRSGSRLQRFGTLAACLAGVALGAARAGADLPPENSCPVLSGGPTLAESTIDAVPTPLREGLVLGLEDLLLLEELLPEEVWQHREVFFYEGMRLEVGPCHRRYPFPESWTRATEAFADRATVDEEGNLHGYVAGLPFPPDAIDPEDPQAGVRWAWNVEHRHRGAGPVGRFRLIDLPTRVGSPETYLGEFFFVRTAHRADLAENDYRVSDADDMLWAAGGRFTEPFNARHLAWRQFRTARSAERYKQPDETFVYVPTMRKPRRAASTWVDGLYTPRYRVSGDSGGGPIPFGSSEVGPTGTIQPTAGLSIAATEHIRRGFVGLALRPNAYDWRYLGERDVLAPINGERPGWPTNPERNYGPSGLSVASDRWDLRHVVVIEGQARRKNEDAAYVKLYVDYQTQQPLYYITRRSNRLLLDVGILVWRFSGDTHAYAELPEDALPPHVFDPVAAVFYSTESIGTGWRRESYDVRSVPAEPDAMREMTSMSGLAKGR